MAYLINLTVLCIYLFISFGKLGIKYTYILSKFGAPRFQDDLYILFLFSVTSLRCLSCMMGSDTSPYKINYLCLKCTDNIQSEMYTCLSG